MGLKGLISQWADLTGADLTGAYLFYGADFSGADLTEDDSVESGMKKASEGDNGDN